MCADRRLTERRLRSRLCPRVTRCRCGGQTGDPSARETKADDTAKVLTMDEARRVASNIAKLPRSSVRPRQLRVS